MHNDVVWAEQIARYIASSLAQPLHLREVAAHFHISPFHLARRFKRVTGQSLHQYILRQRVAAARDLLIAGVGPLSEVAARTGFADHSHLTRQFRHYTGETPSDFLKRLVEERKNQPG